MSKNCSNYSTYSNSTPRFFNFIISTPLLLTLFLAKITNFTQDNITVSVYSPYPAVSLDPRIADDWSSFFIINHIYPRIYPEDGYFRSQTVLEDLEIKCTNEQMPLHNSECKSFKVTGKFKNGMRTCTNKEYRVENFFKELELIAKSKAWLLPGFKKCTLGNKICFEIDKKNNPESVLRSIYLRFGWGESENEKIFGIMPNCFVKTFSREMGFYGEISLDSGKIVFTDKLQNPDIDLFSSFYSGDKEMTELSFYNPIYFYSVINGTHAESVSTKLENTIASELLSRKLIDTSEVPDTQKHKKVLLRKEYVLPDFIDGCIEISKNLNKSTGLNYSCQNIVNYTENIVKRSNINWFGFMSTLTPGLPGRDGINYQYFNPDSTDHWLGRFNPKKSRVSLIGIKNGLLRVKKNKYCSITPNPLGLSDLTIDDFRECN